MQKASKKKKKNQTRKVKRSDIMYGVSVDVIYNHVTHHGIPLGTRRSSWCQPDEDDMIKITYSKRKHLIHIDEVRIYKGSGRRSVTINPEREKWKLKLKRDEQKRIRLGQ